MVFFGFLSLVFLFYTICVSFARVVTSSIVVLLRPTPNIFVSIHFAGMLHQKKYNKKKKTYAENMSRSFVKLERFYPLHVRYVFYVRIDHRWWSALRPNTLMLTTGQRRRHRRRRRCNQSSFCRTGLWPGQCWAWQQRDDQHTIAVIRYIFWY